MMDALTKLNDDFLSCSICTEIFKDPCTIGCYHTFCRGCLTKFTTTRRDAITAKSILCPSCWQMTKVPRPQEPVEQWCQQFKPSFLIQGLLDTFTSEQAASSAPIQDCCFTCKQIGKTSQATSVCQDCDIILCDSCSKIHTATPNSADHEMSTLTGETKTLKKRKVMCQEHNSLVEFCCKDCQKAVCHKCCIVYHRKCHSVVTIDSMIPEMKEVLRQNCRRITSKLHRIQEHLQKHRSQVENMNQQKNSLQSDISRGSKKAMDVIRQKEKILMDELDKLTQKGSEHVRCQIKSGEVEQQTYQQYSEFIKQVLQSESPMDLYDMYVMCQSGEISCEIPGHQKHDADFLKISFKEFDVNEFSLSFQLGDLNREIKRFIPKLLSSVNIMNENDLTTSDPDGIVVLNINDQDILVVADSSNNFVKSCYTKEGRPVCHSLKLQQRPYNVIKHQQCQDTVLVLCYSRSNFHQVKLSPDPVYLCTIHTRKQYQCMTALDQNSLIAGSDDPLCIDFLDLSGNVLKSVAVPFMKNLRYLCTTSKGHIVVTDWGSKSVYCVTQQGEVLFQHHLTDGNAFSFGGVTTNNNEIIVADHNGNKIISLTETGSYVRDLLTSRDGIKRPQGLYVHKNNLYVTQVEGGVNVFRLVSS